MYMYMYTCVYVYLGQGSAKYESWSSLPLAHSSGAPKNGAGVSPLLSRITRDIHAGHSSLRHHGSIIGIVDFISSWSEAVVFVFGCFLLFPCVVQGIIPSGRLRLRDISILMLRWNKRTFFGRILHVSVWCKLWWCKCCWINVRTISPLVNLLPSSSRIDATGNGVRIARCLLVSAYLDGVEVFWMLKY